MVCVGRDFTYNQWSHAQVGQATRPFRCAQCNDRSPVPVRQYLRCVRNKGSRPSDDYQPLTRSEPDTYTASRGSEVSKQLDYVLASAHAYPSACLVLSSSRSCYRLSRIWSSFTIYISLSAIDKLPRCSSQSRRVHPCASSEEEVFSIWISLVSVISLPCAQHTSSAVPYEDLVFLVRCLSQTVMLRNGWCLGMDLNT